MQGIKNEHEYRNGNQCRASGMNMSIGMGINVGHQE